MFFRSFNLNLSKNLRYVTSELVELSIKRNVSSTKPIIPRLIHQTWSNKTTPKGWLATVQSVRTLNLEDFDYCLWTDEMMDSFMKEKYPQFYKNIFIKYRYKIQRVDTFRYFLMYHYGGIYIDMDIGCIRPLLHLIKALEDNQEKETVIACFPETKPLGVSNDFLISTKNHPLFSRMINKTLSFWNRNFILKYLTVMLSTGSMFLTIQTYIYPKNVRILQHDLYSGYSPSSFTWHTTGSTWHKTDGLILLFIYNKRRMILYLALGLIILWMLFCLKILSIKRISTIVQRLRKVCVRKNGIR
ncbi:unnamed protein product [Didymodactylos carnosus]|uniref:Glycosyltransferase n=1 Tax=Didymodactylos carnosus TaxID=1234261 RepID=A0A814Y4Q3_9BILA|nr:unnamed protein product [Didymodactylos carnosus]CAF3987508.1 unnamed protein product [Didymodactylos carnosus]